MSESILYLVSKYTGREAESLKENQDAWLALDAKGFTVYSPICHTHHIEEYRIKKLCPICHLELDCVCEGGQSYYCYCCKQPYYLRNEMFFHNAEAKGASFRPYNFKQPDYVARDLRLIEALMRNDYRWCMLWKENPEGYLVADCNDFCDENPSYCVDECKIKLSRKYDSGVVGVVLPSAIASFIELGVERKIVWNSMGAAKEYDFMKAHHILMITLETALTVPRDQWGEYKI